MNNQKQNFDTKLIEALGIVRQLFPQLASAQTESAEAFRKQAAEINKKAKENRDLALEFLHDANIDLRACKVLRQKKLHAPSIYHLQQAAEKANKAWALGLGILDKKELIKIRHKTPLTLLYVLKKEAVQPLIQLIDNMGPSFTTDISSVLKIVKRQSQPDIAKMSEVEIENHLSKIRIIDNMGSPIDNTIVMLINSLDPNARPPQLGQLICAGMSMFILGAITFPHEAYTRYSDGDAKAGELLPRDYDSNLGIVKSMPKIERLLASKIKLLNNLLT